MLKQIGPNQTQIHMNGLTILYSYETPVAVRNDKTGKEYRSNHKFSKTTSKHLNAWCDPKALEVTQKEIEAMIK